MRERTLAVATALVCALATASALSARGAGFEKTEKAYAEKAAAEWVRLGRWCLNRGLGEKARFCCERAEEICPSVKGLDGLKEKAAALESEGDQKALKSWDGRLASCRRRIAGYYDRIVSSAGKGADAETQKKADEYMFRALELSPTESRWGRALSRASKAAAAKKFERAARIAERALRMKPPEKFVPKFKDVRDASAVDGIVLRTASSHPMKYYLSLPRGFKRRKGRKWPVLVVVEGAGSGFKGRAFGYRRARDGLRFIIVCPCTFSNTNAVEGRMLERYREFYTDEVIKKAEAGRLDWDEKGILAMIEDLKADYDAEAAVYITGFSGGGNATYMMIFKHPDLLAGAAPACANFFGEHLYRPLKGRFSKEDLTFPIHLINGADDPHRRWTKGNRNAPGIEPQADRAERLLKEFGYPNVKRTTVPGMGHDPAYKHVIETFKPYWSGRKRRGDPPD